jgi:hypothetical protein
VVGHFTKVIFNPLASCTFSKISKKKYSHNPDIPAIADRPLAHLKKFFLLSSDLLINIAAHF